MPTLYYSLWLRLLNLPQKISFALSQTFSECSECCLAHCEVRGLRAAFLDDDEVEGWDRRLQDPHLKACDELWEPRGVCS